MSKQDFLVEIGTEELPPKSLHTLGLAFKEGIEQGLVESKLDFAAIEWFAAPRRLAVLVRQLDERAADQQQEILGPPEKIAFDADGKATKAALAFAQKNGIAADDLQVVETDKGRRLVHCQIAPGVVAAHMLPELVQTALDKLPIPRKMHWGALRAQFVRPVHWVVMLLGEQVLTSIIMTIESGQHSRGHRFHHPEPLRINHPAEYASTLLEQGKVVADFSERRNTIRAQVEAQAAALGCTAVIDDDLLDEVTALVEWPVAMAGNFDHSFLEVPAEALVSSMKEHQKYFHVVDAQGKLQPNFIFVANLESSDPQQIISGNEKVIRPRLADAAFFYATDLKHTLESRRERLKTVVFQQQLGTLWDKSARVAALAEFIAPQIDADPLLAKRAAQLAKTDLLSEMVFEFADLQGIAGYYYALHDGETPEVAAAMQEQYLPRFAGDKLPQTPSGNALALADRIDTLTGIFGINQAPSGSKDPFALRRAALGVIRIIREQQFTQLDLHTLIDKAVANYGAALSNQKVAADVSDFIFDRYRAIYQGEGVDTNTVVAVQNALQNAGGAPHNPYDVALRIAAVESFSQLPEAEALSAANKRVQNILAKQQGTEPAGAVNPLLLEAAEEQALHTQLVEMASAVPALCTQQRYTEALRQLAGLRCAIDNFFDHVMVMDENPALQKNRINLLAELNALFMGIADISQLQNRAAG